MAYDLVAFSPAALEAGAKVTTDIVVGAADYQSGATNYISGLRLVDEYTYSITISSDYVPYYYDLSYASLSPLYLPQYASAELTVKDDGEGVYLDGGSLVASELDASRWIYEGRVSAGPYQMVSYDAGASEAVVEINPNYAGNFEGQKPSIEQIVMVKAVQETEFDALKTGSIDVLNQLTDGNEINTALDLVEEGGYGVSAFERNGYGQITFQCDFGPTQFEAVATLAPPSLRRCAMPLPTSSTATSLPTSSVRATAPWCTAPTACACGCTRTPRRCSPPS